MCGVSGLSTEMMVGDKKSHGLIDDVSQMSLDDLSFWLPRFVMEVKKEKGDDYPPNSLYSLCCGIQQDYGVMKILLFQILIYLLISGSRNSHKF